MVSQSEPHPTPMPHDGLRNLVLSNEQYHSHPAVSKSHLDQINRSPAHYWARYLDPAREPTAPTEAMMLGTAAHTAILEPHLWDEQFVVAPQDAPRRPTAAQRNAAKPSAATVDAIEFWDAFDKAAATKTVLSAEDDQRIKQMARAVHLHPASSFLLDLPAQREPSYFWTDADTGIECKVRPDWFSPERKLVVDVKTTDNASPEEFKRSCFKWRYHVQAAWYLRGLEADQFLFIAVEKQPPYLVAVYAATPEMVAAGGRAADRNLTTLAECRAADRWPGYSEEIQLIDLPRFCDD